MTGDLYVIRERGPKRPDETLAEYAARVVAGAPRPDPKTLDDLVRLLRPGEHRTPDDGGAS